MAAKVIWSGLHNLLCDVFVLSITDVSSKIMGYGLHSPHLGLSMPSINDLSAKIGMDYQTFLFVFLSAQ